jgi:signal transduction histidine kinase/CheY-like chemotaxis protein
LATTSLISSYSASSPSPRADGSSSSSPPRLLEASVAFRVVGVGASAGGMDAFRELLRHLPEDTGMAFVLIQHLHRTRANVLCETLAKATRMVVSEVQASTPLVPNCVYVIPATADVTMRVNRLSLVPRPTDSGKPHAPVNLFLNSLAAARGHRSVGVLLSGNTTDGTDGLRAIKDALGVTMVQEPSSAKFGDMPAHAIRAGVVEFCLPIPELARKLASLCDDDAQDASAFDARSSGRNQELRNAALPPPAGGVDFDAARHFDRLLVSRYCPAAALVDDQLEVLLTRGQFTDYVQLAPGVPRSNLSRMTSGRMLAELKTAIARSKVEQSPVRIDAVEVGLPESGRTCNVVVSPFSGPRRRANDQFVVAFEDPSPRVPRLGEDVSTVEKLQYELSATREHLYSLVEDHDHARAVLAQVNDALEARSREVESANDELESLNDELMNTNRLLKERNDELSRVSADLMNLLVSVDVAIVILDPQLSVRRFSPKAQALFNLRATDLGRPFHEIVSTLDAADLQSRLAAVLESLVVQELELKDRSGRWLRMHIRPYRTLLQQVEGVVLSVVDIHELKHHLQEATRTKLEVERAKQLAEQGGRAREHFMSLVTHELRTPLASVVMHAQLLRSGALDRARTEEALLAIERAASMQSQMVNDLIDLSLLEAGRLELNFASFELCDVIRETLAAFAPLVARKSLNLRTELDDSVGQIYSDAARVRQIAGYIVGNAIKSTPAGGEIAVTLSIEDGDACLCVRDSGIGIDPELLPDIFAGSPSRVGLSSRSGRRGGLGLAIARHLVDALGGRLTAKSAGLDRGATFNVTLPMTNSLAARSESDALVLPIAARPLDRPADTQSYTELQGVRVLVLDDEEGTLEAVQTVCRLAGLEVRGASTVTDALREFDRFAPQILVCDPILSREDGLKFIRQIRARAPEQGGLVPAMALTAVTGREERERAIAAGFQLYVAKPLDIDLLRDAMLRLVRHDRARHQS